MVGSAKRRISPFKYESYSVTHLCISFKLGGLKILMSILKTTKELKKSAHADSPYFKIRR